MKDEEKKDACHCCGHDEAHEHDHDHGHHHDEDDDCCCGHDHGHHHDHDDDDNGCCCGHDHEHEEGDGKNLLIRLGIAAVLFCVGFGLKFSALPTFVSAIAFGAAYLVAGYRVLLEAIESIRDGDWFGEEFLMSIASLGAFAIGEMAESCAVVILFELGEYLQGRAVAKSRGSIKQMLELRPEKVTVEKDGKLITMAPEEVQIDDIVVIAPGEKVSLDGVLVEGTGDMDLSALRARWRTSSAASQKFIRRSSAHLPCWWRSSRRFSASAASRPGFTVRSARLRHPAPARWSSRCRSACSAVSARRPSAAC